MSARRFASGFSIIELLITISVLSISMLAVFKVFNFQLEANKFVRAQAEVTDLAYEARVAFRDLASCDANIANFATTNFDTSSLGTVEINLNRIERAGAPPSVVIANGLTTEQGHFVQEIRMINVTDLGGLTSFSAEIEIVISPQGVDNAGGSMKRTIPISFAATLAGTTATITNCINGAPPPATTTTDLQTALSQPNFPHYVICQNGGVSYVFHVGQCDAVSCRYRLLSNTGSSHNARYTSVGATANRTAQAGQGANCPAVINLDGSNVQGP